MDGPENRFALATAFRRYRPGIVIVAAGRTPAASPDHHQGHLIVEAARFYSQLTKWDDRFDGTAPYRVPHLVYVPFPIDAEERHWHSTFVVDISDTIEQKLAAVEAYRSQFDAERFAPREALHHLDERLPRLPLRVHVRRTVRAAAPGRRARTWSRSSTAASRPPRRTPGRGQGAPADGARAEFRL